MRVPLPSILYAASAALIAGSSWLIYDSRELWQQQTSTDATMRGRDNAIKFAALGKGKVRTTGNWNYSDSAWWQQMKGINLIGYVPKVEVPGPTGGGEETLVPVATPLEDIFELVVCFHRPSSDEGVQSHVVIRYKQEAQVKPPQWWLDENTSVARARSSNRTLMAQPSDRVGNRRTPSQQPAPRPHASMAGREVLQHLSVDAQGDVRRASSLWGDYRNIRLLRVDPSGESAWFVRDVASLPGEPKVEPKEEEILKTSAGISQKLALALRQLQGREGAPTTTIVSTATTRDWLDVESTTRIGNEFHIGRNDERMFENPADLFAGVHLDTFVSRYSDARGLVVRSIKPELAAKFGIQTDDVLLSVNGRDVSSKPQAANMAKRSYQRGVRTFTTKWWSNGQEVERVYRARD
jgi:hypothetical protein